jgi:hypothetical protein
MLSGLVGLEELAAALRRREAASRGKTGAGPAETITLLREAAGVGETIVIVQLGEDQDEPEREVMRLRALARENEIDARVVTAAGELTEPHRQTAAERERDYARWNRRLLELGSLPGGLSEDPASGPLFLDEI